MNLQGGPAGWLQWSDEAGTTTPLQLQQQHYPDQYNNYSQYYNDHLQHRPQQIAKADIAAGAAIGAQNERESRQLYGNPNEPHAGSTTARGSVSASGSSSGGGASALSRYESQKRRDWNTFGQYLRNHRPPLALAKCSGAHVLEFLKYLDQFGKTKVHAMGCPFFGQLHPPAPCRCPLRQAWGSLDALIGRLRAAFEEHGGRPESNPFGTRVVRLYLREVREMQAKARGIAYEKKKRKKPTTGSSAAPTTTPPTTSAVTTSSSRASATPPSNPRIPLHPLLHTTAEHPVDYFASPLLDGPLQPPTHDVMYATSTNFPCSSSLNVVPQPPSSTDLQSMQFLHPLIQQRSQPSMFD